MVDVDRLERRYGLRSSQLAAMPLRAVLAVALWAARRIDSRRPGRQAQHGDAYVRRNGAGGVGPQSRRVMAGRLDAVARLLVGAGTLPGPGGGTVQVTGAGCRGGSCGTPTSSRYAAFSLSGGWRRRG